MKKIFNLLPVLFISAFTNAGIFLETSVSMTDTDVDSLKFLNPIGKAATSNSTTGNYINLQNHNQNNQDNGRSFKIGLDYSGFDIYLTQKSFGSASATGTATFSSFVFTQKLMLDIDVLALGISYPFNIGGKHSIAPLIEIGQADIDVTGQQINPAGNFTNFPLKSIDDSTFSYGLSYAYEMTDDVNLTVAYIVNDLGDANTGVTGTGIAGMNAGEQLQSDLEVSELTFGLKLNF